jgi:hypothetical protein
LERIPKLSADQFLEAARQNAVVDPMANARPSTQLRNAAAREDVHIRCINSPR